MEVSAILNLTNGFTTTFLRCCFLTDKAHLCWALFINLFYFWFSFRKKGESSKNYINKRRANEKSKTSCFSICIRVSSVSDAISSTDFRASIACPIATGSTVTSPPTSAASAEPVAKKTADNRSGFVKGAMEKAFFESGQQYNVMVMNLSQGYNPNQLQGVQYFDTVDYDGITFGV